ncbi:MAG: ribosome hibernation-promoting factor, HPF/YfiA family [Myxococcales bacterium]
MKVLIQGKQLKVPDDLKRYVQERLVEPLTRFYDDEAAEIRVEFGDTNGPKGGRDKECHLTFRMPGAKTIQIEEYTTDLYASLDIAADRLVRVVKKEIGRMRDTGGHKEKPLGSVDSEGGVPGGLLEDLPHGNLFGGGNE